MPRSSCSRCPSEPPSRVAAATGRLAPALSKHLEETAASQPTADAATEEGPRATAPSIGAVLTVPFAPEESLPSGRIVVCRQPGRPPFSQAEVAEMTGLASQLQVALHLAHARDDQQRLMLIEERQRIARDLHDTVIQDMLALGMEMSAELPNPSDPRRVGAHRRTSRATRGHGRQPQAGGLPAARHHWRSIARARGHGRGGPALARFPAAPMVTFAGPLDPAAPDLVDDLIAVLREALSNVARHAGATRVAVSVTVMDADVVLVVDDDGIGLTGFLAGWVRGA